uniref:Uncharacterized protein n=1 Tax=Arundo donax TaxID=35708 RepID=A0A0A8XQA0_ARUDO
MKLTAMRPDRSAPLWYFMVMAGSCTSAVSLRAARQVWNINANASSVAAKDATEEEAIGYLLLLWFFGGEISASSCLRICDGLGGGVSGVFIEGTSW